MCRTKLALFFQNFLMWHPLGFMLSIRMKLRFPLLLKSIAWRHALRMGGRGGRGCAQRDSRDCLQIIVAKEIKSKTFWLFYKDFYFKQPKLECLLKLFLFHVISGQPVLLDCDHLIVCIFLYWGLWLSRCVRQCIRLWFCLGGRPT